jgi:hypothetical protein
VHAELSGGTNQQSRLPMRRAHALLWRKALVINDCQARHDRAAPVPVLDVGRRASIAAYRAVVDAAVLDCDTEARLAAVKFSILLFLVVSSVGD